MKKSLYDKLKEYPEFTKTLINESEKMNMIYSKDKLKLELGLIYDSIDFNKKRNKKECYLITSCLDDNDLLDKIVTHLDKDGYNVEKTKSISMCDNLKVTW